jgi:16S rRNA processing protein RimM
MQLVVGRITRPHGVRGEVSVEVRTDDPDLRFAVGRVMATDPAAAGPLTVESVRWHSGRLLIRFAGIADRNQAEELRGTWLTLDSAEVGSTGDPDEFHDHELIGLAVVTTLGEPVGRVTDVRHFGQDLLVIEPAPASSSAVPEAGAAEAGPAEGGTAEAGTAETGAAKTGTAEAGAAEAGPAETGPVPTGPAQAGRGPGGPARAARAQRGNGLGSELLIPFVAAIVPEVDVAAGRLVIDPPPGLLELGTGEPGQAGANPAGPGPAATGPAGADPAGPGTAGS